VVCVCVCVWGVCVCVCVCVWWTNYVTRLLNNAESTAEVI